MNLSIETISHCSLEALAVDDGGAALVVLLLGDPHLLEGGEGGQDGSSDPDGVPPIQTEYFLSGGMSNKFKFIEIYCFYEDAFD